MKIKFKWKNQVKKSFLINVLKLIWILYTLPSHIFDKLPASTSLIRILIKQFSLFSKSSGYVPVYAERVSDEIEQKTYLHSV